MNDQINHTTLYRRPYPACSTIYLHKKQQQQQKSVQIPTLDYESM